MELRDILNILAIIIAPIVSVIIAQKLQERSEKRKDKMYIFRVLMMSRIYGWTIESVNALNIIDVVFANDAKVRKAWKELLDSYSSTEQSDLMNKKRENLRYKLIETIADNLGYKNKITWETVQNPYIPQGMVNQIKEQNASRQAYDNLLYSMVGIIPKNENSDKEQQK